MPLVRCPRCLMAVDRCFCPDLARARARLPSAPHLLIVRHALEDKKPSNTGRVAALAWPGAELVDFGKRGNEGAAAAAIERAVARGTTALLYPGGAPSAPAAAVETLVVVDGTWSQAGHMLQRIRGLGALPRLVLPPPLVASPRLRRGQRPEQMSTLEAISAAMEVIGPPGAAESLRTLLTAFVERAKPATPRH